MADLNELVLAYDELVVKNRKLIYEELFRPKVKEALLDPEKSMKNSGKYFVVEWTDPLPKDSSDTDVVKMIRRTMKDCARMLADEGFMFVLDKKDIQVKETTRQPRLPHLFERTKTGKLDPWFEDGRPGERMVDIRLTFTRAEPLNTVKSAR
jgi:hypothetical protein